MSQTLHLADESKKLLDNGYAILLYRNMLDSYTGVVFQSGPMSEVLGNAIEETDEARITDDFEPSQVLYRLTEKVFGNIV